jgi:Domain of unknown function (DUF3576)
MRIQRFVHALTLGGAALAVASCGSGNPGAADAQRAAIDRARAVDSDEIGANSGGSSLTELFTNQADPNTTVEVNRYLWVAAQDILNFLPIESVDPFTGVIVTGFGTPPGSSRAYRATIYVQDPALDARSLRVSLVSRGGGPVAPDVQQAVEDAILTRARQLRIQDANL